jgi:hypothetical protein
MPVKRKIILLSGTVFDDDLTDPLMPDNVRYGLLNFANGK